MTTFLTMLWKKRNKRWGKLQAEIDKSKILVMLLKRHSYPADDSDVIIANNFLT